MHNTFRLDGKRKAQGEASRLPSKIKSRIFLLKCQNKSTETLLLKFLSLVFAKIKLKQQH